MKTALFLLTLALISCASVSKDSLSLKEKPVTQPNLTTGIKKIKDSKAEELLVELLEISSDIHTKPHDLSPLFKVRVTKPDGEIETTDYASALHIFETNTGSSEKVKTQAIFETLKPNETIITCHGKGLWGPVWGMMLIDYSTMTVKKISLNHKSETPGLGAEIRDSIFENRFKNKPIDLEESSFSMVVKDDARLGGKTQIDGLTGATITSDGTFRMINSSIRAHSGYLAGLKE